MPTSRCVYYNTFHVQNQKTKSERPAKHSYRASTSSSPVSHPLPLQPSSCPPTRTPNGRTSAYSHRFTYKGHLIKALCLGAPHLNIMSAEKYTFHKKGTSKFTPSLKYPRGLGTRTYRRSPCSPVHHFLVGYHRVTTPIP